MLVLSASDLLHIVTPELALGAVSAAFVATATANQLRFPVLAARGTIEGTRVNIKYGCDPHWQVAGLKVGTFWPDNKTRGEPNHGATTLVLDDLTGRPVALLNASSMNGIRTAAANAVAARALARPDSGVLAVFGTGRQASYEIAAVAKVLPIREILIVGRDCVAAERLAVSVREDGLNARAADTDEALSLADVVTTVTTAKSPLFDSALVRAGTHISAMGADAVGKQELPTLLAENALCFADDPVQSVQIGEFQHSVAAGIVMLQEIGFLGDVITGILPGRTDAYQITIFDSSGLALQDLAVAVRAIDVAREQGLGQEIAF